MTDRTREDVWQPIETAPKDGTRVILYGDFFSPELMIGKWNKVEGDEQTWEGWEWSAYIPNNQEEITHWMPLPEAPGRRRPHADA